MISSKTMLEAGQIFRFFYLWKRQALSGKVSGRKARPACVVMRLRNSPETAFLFPITSQLPDDGRISLPISQIECRRSGLVFPCWIILDEYNRVEVDKVFDFESTDPIGSFSPAFLQKIALTIKSAASDRKLQGVSRI